jgi:amino acid adenylation domain-containing protein
LLTESAAVCPERTALRVNDRAVTFEQLESRSNQLARFLGASGLRRGDRVGLYLPKSVESIVGIFGILKAGGIYVPLDPQAPVERIGYMINDCGIRYLITTNKLRMISERVVIPTVEVMLLTDTATHDCLKIQTVAWENIESESTSVLPQSMISNDVAYLLYTSGSTGRPKAVVISHENALTFVRWCIKEFRLCREDRVSNHAPLHFDLSVFDVYGSIGSGATLYMLSEDAIPFPTSVAAFVKMHQITVWYSVPSALVNLIVRTDMCSFASVRLILFAGEVFPGKYIRKLIAAVPQAELYNLYGPTETNVCTYARLEPAEIARMASIPIGKACANIEVFAVDEKGEKARPGGVGELYVRGPSVTSGYWGDPEKTKEVLVRNPFQRHFEEKVYRTGDWVRQADNGNYWFLGRRDRLCKIRGYRIELAEVESTLLTHASVKEAAVVVIGGQDSENRLKAVVVPHESVSLTAVEIRQHCARQLPRYMVPEVIEICEQLPRISNGKVDRMRLEQNQSPVDCKSRLDHC